jgi:HEAT repeat protein/DNA polymerase III delta prime subunit
MSPLENLLQQCTVKLSLLGRIGWGTGFFVAPGWILTCAHVVQEAKGEPVQVRWQKQENWAQALVERTLTEPFDLALLRVMLPTDANPPCVYLDESVYSRDPLYLFGYPDQDFPNGCPVTFNCEGLTGDEPALIKFALGQVRPGMSGSPLLNQRTGKVCGMVKFTRDRSFDLGGGGVSTRVILEQFPELRSFQQVFHGGDRRWINLITPPEIDFQPYREAVISHYSQQRHLYTPTDALLPLEARSVLPQEPKDGQEQPPEKTVEQFPVLEGLRKYALGNQREHVLLAGRPGSGKSTTLQQLAVSLAEEGQVPVLVQLKGDRPVPELIQAEFRRRKQPVKPEQIDEWLLDDRLVLLLDGVNEIPNNDLRILLAQFREDNPTVPMIFTTRDLSLGGDLGIDKRLEMKPLSQQQMREFVGKYLPEQGDRLLGQLGDRLRELAETPLLLKLLCDVFDPETNLIPQNRGELFQWFDRDYRRIKKEIEYVSVSENFWEFKSEMLQYLAFSMIQGDLKTTALQKPPEPWLTIHKSRAAEILETWLYKRGGLDAPTKAKLWLKDLCNHHLLQDAAKLDEIEFHHQLFQEYYAAGYLLKLLPNLTDEQLKQDYLNYLKWTEPFGMMLEMLEDREKSENLLWLARYVDWNLGFNLTVKLSSQSTKSLPGQLNETKLLELSPESLEEDNIQSLLEKLDSSESETRREAAKKLGELFPKKPLKTFSSREENPDFFAFNSATKPKFETSILTTVVKSLIRTVEDPDNFVRYESIWALTKLGSDLEKLDSEECVPTLLKVLNNPENGDLCSSAALALVEIGSKTAIQGLINATDHLDPKIRGYAVWAIGRFDEEIAFPVLLKTIEDENSYVRCWTVRLFGRFKSEIAVQSLLKATKDSDEWVRSSAVSELSKFNSDIVIQAIFEALEDPLPTVRCAAVKALVKTNSEMIVPELTKAIKDSDEHVRFEAAKALAELGSEVAIPELLQVIEKWIGCAREVVEALGKINSEASLLELIKLFDRSIVMGFPIPPIHLHSCVADVLSEININSEPSALALINAVDNPDPRIRESVGKLLKNITFKEVVPKLERLIHHLDVNIRKGAIEALGNIGSEKTVRKLSEAIEDPLPEIRSTTVKALISLGFKSTIPNLLRVLEDLDFYVRANTIEGLGKIGAEDAVSALAITIDEPDREYEYNRREESSYSFSFFGYGPNSIIRAKAIEALGKIASKDAIEVLLKAIGHTDGHVREVAARVLGEIDGDAAIKCLSHLQKTYRSHSTGWYEANKAIAALQKRCQFYNYEIFQAHLESQKGENEEQGSATQPPTTIFNIETLHAPGAAINLGGTIQGDQIGSQPHPPEP